MEVEKYLVEIAGQGKIQLFLLVPPSTLPHSLNLPLSDDRVFAFGNCPLVRVPPPRLLSVHTVTSVRDTVKFRLEDFCINCLNQVNIFVLSSCPMKRVLM